MSQLSESAFAVVVGSGDYSSAVKLLDAAIDETRQDYTAALHRLVQLHLNRGICNQKLQLNRKALKDFDAALALMPSNLKALLHKGQVLQAMGKPQEARIVWGAATGLSDPASDLEVLLEVQAALAGILRTPGNTAPSTPDTTATSGAADAAEVAVPAAGSDRVASPPPAPAVPARVEPKANGAAAAIDSLPGALVEASSFSAAPPADTPPAAGSTTSSSSSHPKSKMAKGFFSSSCSSKGMGSGAKPAAAAKSPASSAAAEIPLRSSSISAADSVIEIDCAAGQQQQQQGQQAVPGTFGAQVQQMAQNSVAMQIAINQINAGQLEQAESLLDGVLSSNPHDLSALVARGTARALRSRLKEAVSDFSRAIEIEPRYPDTYKRRGQARSALGDVQGALEDLDKAATLLASMPGAEELAGGPADCYAERGILYQKQRDYRRAVKELSKATDLDPKNAMAWNYLGLCKVSMGDIRQGCKAYEKAIELVPDMKEAWLNLGQALKEEGRVKDAERALTKAMTNPDGSACLAAYRLLATMRQGQGRQLDAIKVLSKALGYRREEQKIELLYLRALCYHALGYVRKAVADYEACMNCTPGKYEGPVAEERRMFQFLSFYQRETALFTHLHLDKKSAELCLDTELSDVFKECWCKKGPPSHDLFARYKVQQPLPPERSSSRGSSSGGADADAPAFDAAAAEQVAALTAVADTLGQLLQNHHQGFLPNVRQQRAAGYAAVELGQAVRALLVEKRAGREGLWVNSEGASGQGGCSGRHLFGWRDAMDIVVKWRQLSEPGDQVVWVDLLTQREFEAGFGSHTPMYSGQTKCVRYYMNFSRALELAKECLLEKGHAYDAMNREVPLGSNDKQESVQKAKTALELYRIIGQDSWVVVPLHSILKALKQKELQQDAPSTSTSTSSTSVSSTNSSKASSHPSTTVSQGPKRIADAMVPPGCIEGTRLTLVKVPNQPDAVEFSIRTPVTPPRWKEFDAELEAAWDRIISALLLGDKPLAAQAIMSYTYYWYNFMPLARGTAAVGYTTMLGLFWAAGIPITQPIPQDYQVDWEAILAKHPQQFIDRLSAWLVPEAALPVPRLPTAPAADAAGTTGSGNSNCTSSKNVSPASSPRGSDAGSNSKVVAAAKALPDIEGLPGVAHALSTIRQRLNALNGLDAQPV